ncbi:MAG TPA: ATP-binding protein [Terriglobales bacterium]|nr:ATP-binding protein [Terriglobales bacterium]
MERDSLNEAHATAESAVRLLGQLVDRLPLSVAVYGVGPEYLLVYRNRRMAEQMSAVPGFDVPRLQHRALRACAERLAASGGSEMLRTSVQGRDGETLIWEWTLSPLIGPGGQADGVMVVVADLSQPLRARQRVEAAVDLGMHLLLEVARLAEEHAGVGEFLAALSEHVGLLVHADRVAFHTYDPSRKLLVPSDGSPLRASAATAGGLPCDPDASDPLAQVVFAGRVYRGTLDFDTFEFGPYSFRAQLGLDMGTKVIIVPWRAGNERLGALVASGVRGSDDFTDEDAIVLIAAGHAAGLVWQRKRAEQKLSERADELASLERIKSNFLMLASHELRTPLTVLNGYISLLADGSRGPDRMAEVVPILQQAMARMNALVDQLMDATRLTDGKVVLRREVVDLRELISRVAARVLTRQHRELDFGFQLPDGPVSALVDVVRIETAVENLLDNAFKYSEPGDAVRCELHADRAFVRLVVRDDGMGMTAEEVAGLFTRFGRKLNAKNSHIAGTGLGLYLSREIVRLHGGDISATSRPDAGTTFELALPATAPGEDG